jgi:2'-5' RNA ligase
VLWVGLAGDVHALRTLAVAAGAAARAAGVALDVTARYGPRLALARAGRTNAGLRAAAAELAQIVGPVWPVTAVQLMHSRLGAGPGGGAVHEPIATWPRRAGGRG